MVSCFSQFHVVKEEKNWTEAQKYCRENFTDLATIENQKEMDAVKAALNGTTGNFWIGLRQKPGETNRSWIWSDGSNFSYSDWYTGEPNNPVGDICVQLWSGNGYRWADVGCHWPDSFVCYEIPLILIKQNKTWREALRYCREKHVDLVSIYNKDIQQWVEFVTKDASTANVWMGLRHTCTLSFWFWVSGESICYQNWAPGNGTEEEDCSDGERTGALQSGSKQWVSLSETQKLNFICSTT
ncbi:C-type lectin lectoxin-Lio2-like [Salminus brasiliensis]|uniref:C-type lectin lectoxin-Lio2-like n=1 Tax=Salminus brasiliensis TaxID=930266 RepID=UPI003B830987